MNIVSNNDTVVNQFHKQNGWKGIFNEFEIRVGKKLETKFDSCLSY